MPLEASRKRPRVSLLGTTAILFESAGDFDLLNQRRIWSLAHQVASWPGVREAVPGILSLMLTFETPPRTATPLKQALLEAWDTADELWIEGRLVELPVIYGGDFGPALGTVAIEKGLSVDEVVEIHSSATYTVFALGSHPGYCYLGGMDPRIAMPRRKVPLLTTPAGSVSIGGAQTGVSAFAGPSGWHAIGRTSWQFFDPFRDPPATLGLGDRIRFRVERIVR